MSRNRKRTKNIAAVPAAAIVEAIQSSPISQKVGKRAQAQKKILEGLLYREAKKYETYMGRIVEAMKTYTDQKANYLLLTMAEDVKKRFSSLCNFVRADYNLPNPSVSTPQLMNMQDDAVAGASTAVAAATITNKN